MPTENLSLWLGGAAGNSPAAADCVVVGDHAETLLRLQQERSRMVDLVARCADAIETAPFDPLRYRVRCFVRCRVYVVAHVTQLSRHRQDRVLPFPSPGIRHHPPRSRCSDPCLPAARMSIPSAGKTPGRERRAMRRSAPTSGCRAFAGSRGPGAAGAPTRRS